jgi:hypothetical protein
MHLQIFQFCSQTLLNYGLTKSLFAAMLITLGGAVDVPSVGLNVPGVQPASIHNSTKVKALYLTGWTVGSEKNVNHYVDLANSTEINAYVVDIKDDDGFVGYESQIPAVREISGWKKKYNADKMLAAFHQNGIRVIGRIVCFKDPVLSAKRTELAIRDARGGVWKDKKNRTWLNPYNQKSWPYLM